MYSILAPALCTLFASAGLTHPSTTPGAPPDLESYLRRIGLGAHELATATAGRAVIKLLPSQNSRDISVFGIIAVRASRDAVLGYALDTERFLTAKGRTFGIVGDSASMSDMRGVAFDESEYRDLRKCRPGDCAFKLAASAMNAFVHEIDWSAADAKARADDLLRDGVRRLVSDYTTRGNEATLAYDDLRGARPGDVFAELAAQSPDLYAYAPELERYLATYPAGRPVGARDVVYWSEDRMPRLRPTLTVNHLIVYTPPAPDSGVAFIARKQLYANHYYEGGFELMAVVEGGGSATNPRAYLMTVRRFRFDHLPRGLFNIRGRVRSEMMDATRKDLDHHRSAIEQGRSP